MFTDVTADNIRSATFENRWSLTNPSRSSTNKDWTLSVVDYGNKVRTTTLAETGRGKYSLSLVKEGLIFNLDLHTKWLTLFGIRIAKLSSTRCYV